MQDTDLLTSFGVYKDGQFKSIGREVLHRPLYDLGTGQFTEIVSSPESGYAWPDYQSRSVMLVGTDYFITYDDVYNDNIGGRFSWFTHPEEALPFIEIVKAGKPGTRFQKTELSGRESKGVWYDVLGDCMALVSHKTGIKSNPASFGAVITLPDGTTDYVFRNDRPLSILSDSLVFEGRAGFIRNKPGNGPELVLFHGHTIGNREITLIKPGNEAGVSAKVAEDGSVDGTFYSLEPSEVTFRWPASRWPAFRWPASRWPASRWPASRNSPKVYLEGVPTSYTQKDSNTISICFPRGRFRYQITTGLPVPSRPSVSHTVYAKNKADVYLEGGAGATFFNVFESTDHGQTWNLLTKTAQPVFSVVRKGTMHKIHLRVTAANSEHESPASPEYPVYFTENAPPHPEGLKVRLDSLQAGLTWGQVLGCRRYRIYRKMKGKPGDEKVYDGDQTKFDDRGIKPSETYEYTVTAINGNGESEKSHPVSTDTDSWLHLEPDRHKKFRRLNTAAGVDPSKLFYPD